MNLSEITKLIILSLLLSVPSVYASIRPRLDHSGVVNAIPEQNAEKKKLARKNSRCKSDIRIDLEKGDRIVDRICLDAYDLVLTQRSLVIFPKADSTEKPLIQLVSITKDVKEIISRGMVDWDASKYASFFLTRDQKLSIVPHEGEHAFNYFLPFETKHMGKARMIFHAGFLFIAPFGEGIRVVSFDKKATWGSISNPIDDPEAGFFISDHRLFFGIKGQKTVELKVNGKRLEQIVLIK